ncbi:hypothetical protein TSOC_013187 [Tetrabaena socialis]|uniref:Uncharacterized protein n=1 Tax=Tetrabaena socialis TaxID=47790 RepID=A0A2J7ZL09_9CHLO|nr:hypothetical protein TSOC_013187 [Tetrabaena socialis]|eukprot:PNH00954.1 hypothetical protein TSOC_013187 [Tetrabaena socialis]
MSQLHEVMAAAVATVLVNGSAAGAEIARALPLLSAGVPASAAAAGHSSAHVPRAHGSAAEGAVQLAVAAVLCNVQRHAPALRAACAAVMLSLRPHMGPQPAEPPAGAPVRTPQRKRQASQEVVMLQHVKARPLSGRIATREAIEELGLGGLPDPQQRIKESVRKKLGALRNACRHGQNPLAGRTTQPAKLNTYSWRGTLLDAAAFLEADPSIAPLLDRRLDPMTRCTPMWRTSLSSVRSRFPEFEATGKKRRRHFVLRFNQQVADELDARKAKRGAKSLPDVGEEAEEP